MRAAALLARRAAAYARIVGGRPAQRAFPSARGSASAARGGVESAMRRATPRQTEGNRKSNEVNGPRYPTVPSARACWPSSSGKAFPYGRRWALSATPGDRRARSHWGARRMPGGAAP